MDPENAVDDVGFAAKLWTICSAAPRLVSVVESRLAKGRQDANHCTRCICQASFTPHRAKRFASDLGEDRSRRSGPDSICSSEAFVRFFDI